MEQFDRFAKSFWSRSPTLTFLKDYNEFRTMLDLAQVERCKIKHFCYRKETFRPGTKPLDKLNTF